MNKKGFTLIELLAVIVILAIIALIAVPIIINIINGTKESSSLRKGELYLDAVEQAIARKNISEDFNPTTCEVQSNGNLLCDGEELVVEVDGEKPTDGTITFDRGIVKKVEDLTYKDVVLETDEKGNLRIKDKSKEEEVKDPVSFETDDWGTIVGNIRKGNTDKYTVGATRQVDLGSLGVHTLRIANTTRPTECDREGFSQTACGFVIEFADIINSQQMNPTNTNVGGWNSNALRTYLNDTIYNALPQELKDVIIDTYVVSGHGNNSGEENFILPNEKLYLLSTHEVWENGNGNKITYDTAWDNTRQLDYYSNLNVTTDNYSGAIKYLSDSAYYWWLRSALSSDANRFYGVLGRGDWYRNGAPGTLGVSPAFRIG